MTVKQLMEILKQVPGDCHVVQSSDPEGNGFWVTSEVGESIAFRDLGMAGVEEVEGGDGFPAVLLWAGYYQRQGE